MSAIAALAARRKRAASNGSPGSAISRQWCGTRARCAAVGLAVPTSRPRYSWRESADTISPPSRSASSSARAVLPDAVGPTTQMMRGLVKSPPREQRLELCASQLSGHRATVGAMGGDLDAVHRGEERVHLGGIEPLADAHDGVAGDGREGGIRGPLGRCADAFLDELRGDCTQERACIAPAQEPG